MTKEKTRRREQESTCRRRLVIPGGEQGQTRGKKRIRFEEVQRYKYAMPNSLQYQRRCEPCARPSPPVPTLRRCVGWGKNKNKASALRTRAQGSEQQQVKPIEWVEVKISVPQLLQTRFEVLTKLTLARFSRLVSSQEHTVCEAR